MRTIDPKLTEKYGFIRSISANLDYGYNGPTGLVDVEINALLPHESINIINETMCLPLVDPYKVKDWQPDPCHSIEFNVDEYITRKAHDKEVKKLKDKISKLIQEKKEFKEAHSVEELLKQILEIQDEDRKSRHNARNRKHNGSSKARAVGRRDQGEDRGSEEKIA